MAANRILGTMILAVAVCGTAVVGDDKAEKPQTPPAAEDVFSGPKVDESAPSDRPDRPGGDRGRARANEGAQPRLWMMAMRDMDLSDEQREKVRFVMQDLQDSMRKFRETHGEEMRGLMETMREARENGTMPPREVAEKLRSLEQSRPKIEQYQEKIWSILNDEQQKELRAKLATMAAQQDERRARRGGGGDAMRQPRMEPGAENPNEMMQERGLRGRWQGERPSRSGGLDEKGQKRVEFLRKHQSKDRPGVKPDVKDMEFEFHEDSPGAAKPE